MLTTNRLLLKQVELAIHPVSIPVFSLVLDDPATLDVLGYYPDYSRINQSHLLCNPLHAVGDLIGVLHGAEPVHDDLLPLLHGQVLLDFLAFLLLLLGPVHKSR